MSNLFSPYQTKTIAEFNIAFLQFLNTQSEVTQAFPSFATDPAHLLELYKKMVLTRALDTKAVNLQRTGKLGTYPSSYGQEAVSVGVGFAMKKTDVFCTYYRDQGTLLARGTSIAELLRYWGGDERGSNFANNREDTPISVPIGTQCLYATGIAYAMQYRDQKRATLVMCGDGGTSQGDFYEALNLAGAWKLPLVFVVNNNKWAISVSRSKQTAAATIAQKAIAAGFEGVQVDGNDVLAVYEAVRLALEKARNGGGPTLIEALTYRLCDHTTADDATRYHDPEQHQQAMLEEPIGRLRAYLEKKGLWNAEKESQLHQHASAEIESGVSEYMSTLPQPLTDMFDYLYAELPEALYDQRAEVEMLK